MECFRRPTYVSLILLILVSNRAGSDQIKPAPSDAIVEPAAEATIRFESATDELSPESSEPKCDPMKCAALKKAVAASHAPLFYNNNFDYLCDPCYGGHALGDSLKRLGANDWLTYDIGGQYRARYHRERNFRGLGLTGRDDGFLLHRTRLYGNFEIGESVRVFVEGLDAESNYEEFAPRRIEVNRSELQQAFADFLVSEDCGGELWVRLGRQEILYGNERVASPLDWANTRRTFEGYKLLWKGTEWDADAFWLRPIFPDDHELDSPDHSQEFMGVYSIYKGTKNQTLEPYFVRYIETDATQFKFNTIGARWNAKQDVWLYELEGAYQWGDFGAADMSAGFYTVGIGRELPNWLWTPTVWAYYDWASGDEIIGAGYHHLFPLSHKYFGWMDLFGRRNIEDLNFLMTLVPHEKWKLTGWWHIFHLQNNGDVPYSVTMTPLVSTPGGDSDLGQELDLTALWAITPRVNLLLGYSHFWRGDFWDTNPSPGIQDVDADFFYAQFTVNF
jgi:hypothetical protein